jgi:late competence protein required for DNA uptake (superfamily II DNA/RNA helicase)
MATNEQLTQRLAWARKQKSYAWAKFYEAQNQGLEQDWGVVRVVERTSDEMPEHIKAEFKAMAVSLKKKWECPVCLDMIDHGDLEITNCGHFYCKPCLASWKKTCKDRGDAKWKCGMCNRQHKFNEAEEA